MTLLKVHDSNTGTMQLSMRLLTCSKKAQAVVQEHLYTTPQLV